MNERKMHIWLKHKKRSLSRWLFSCSMTISIAVFLSAWFGFEALVNNNYHFTIAAFKANQITSDLFVNLSESFYLYLRTLNLVYCRAYGCITPYQDNMISVIAATAQANSRSFQQDLLLNQTADAIDRLRTEILDSSLPYGSDLSRWFSSVGREFDASVGDSSYTSFSDLKDVPTLSYVQTVYSVFVRMNWMIGMQNATGFNTSILLKTDQYLEFKSMLLNDLVPLVMAKLFRICESIKDFYKSSMYDSYVALLLWITGAALGLCYCLQIYSVWSVQTYLNSAIEGYGLLQKTDLSYELDKLAYCHNYFEFGNPFDEKERMNQALAIFVKTSGKDKGKYYQEFKVKKKAANILSKQLEDLSGMKALKLSRNQSNKIKSTRLFKGVMRSLIFGTILIVLIIASSSLIMVVNNLVEYSNSLKLMLISFSGVILKLQMDMSALALYSPYAISGLKSRWTEINNYAQSYRADQEKIVEFWNVWRPTLRSLLGSNSTIENIMYNNMCEEIIKYNKMDSEWTVCSKLNQNKTHLFNPCVAS